MIRSVVDYLLEELRTSRLRKNDGETLTGLGQLQGEFEDLRIRLGEVLEQFTVMTELFVHAQRHADVARILRWFQETWRNHVLEILKSGLKDGSFRNDLDADRTATALMAQFSGIVYHAQFFRAPRFFLTPPSDTLIAEILAQVERWVVSSRPQSEGAEEE